MKGKIFKGSSSIYQDEAKVLFDYYKQAAEKIVAQELRLEKEKELAQAALAEAENDKLALEKNIKILWFICWLIFPLFMIMTKKKQVQELDEVISRRSEDIDRIDKDYKNIFRDYRVDKLGIAYVPVASKVAFNNQSFVVDHTGGSGKERFTLQLLRQGQLINESISDLGQLIKEVPVVEGSDSPEQVETAQYSKSIQKVTFHDYFGKLDRTLRTISFCLNDIDETTVELPVVYPGSAYSRFLAEYATDDPEGAPVFNIFDTTQYDSEIDRFNKLNETRKSMSDTSEQIDTTLRHLMVDMAQSVQTTASMKVKSTASLVEYSNRLLFNILKAPYNFYSPVLEAEEIERIKNEDFDYAQTEFEYKPFNLRESSRMRFDLFSMSWVAEDGSRTISPFGISQIQTEIMAPIVTNLLKETRLERIKVYNHIKDQKIDYLNQWHRDTEDFYGRNRAESADLINLMRANLSEYTAAFNTLKSFKKTNEKMQQSRSLDDAATDVEDNSAEVLASYQLQSQQFMNTQNEFADYMERLHEDIDARAEKFGHVENFDASLRDECAKAAAVARDTVDKLEDRRKPLAEINPLLAKTSELPPEPSIEEQTYEHVAVDLNAVAKDAINDIDDISSQGVPTEESTPADTETPTEPAETPAEPEPTDEPEDETQDGGAAPTADDEEESEEDDNLEDGDEEEDEEEEEDLDDDEEDDGDEDDLDDEEEDEEEGNESLSVGDEAFYFDDNGQKVYYEDGEYTQEDGTIVIIKDGRISEIRND